MALTGEGPPSRRRQIGSIVTAVGLLCLIWLFKISSPSSLPISFNTHHEQDDSNNTPLTTHENETAKGPLSSLITQNVAAIVEGRPIENLAPLILHFSSVLGPEWPIFIFTYAGATIPNSEAFRRALKSKRINIVSLPAETDFKNRDAVSNFFTSPWFWEQLAPAKHILVFQSDSIICSNAPLPIDYFLKYDFVGAPINPNLGHGDEGMNGGLSLRNRTMFLETVRTRSWKEDLATAPNPVDPKIKYEDQWFFHRLRDTQSRTDGGYKASLPTPEEAGKFSIETLWFEGGRPLGYHQAERFHSGDTLKEIDKYCPERLMATTEIITS